MKIRFKGKIWLWDGGKASWFFVSLPTDDAMKLKLHHAFDLKGFGSIPVTVTIGETTWKTSVFPHAKDKTYILPIKAAVRRSENITKGDVVTVMLES